VPVSQGQMLYHALKTRGVPVEMVLWAADSACPMDVSTGDFLPGAAS